MSKRKVEINIDESGNGSVIVDGVDLSMYVGRIEFASSPGERVNVFLEIPAVALSVHADAEVGAFIQEMTDDE